MSDFVIKKGPQEFVVEDGSLDALFDPETRDQCLNIPADRQPDAAAAVLYLLPSAFLELDTHIHWKIQTWRNMHEQGGLMVGDVYRDPETECICGVVQHIIPSENAGNAIYLQFTHEDWSRMLITYEEQFPQQEDGHRPRIIGWYHTHPNMPTHMSQIDKNTHRSFWRKEWQFSAILNPQRGTWEVFNGEECNNCGGVLYYDSQWTPQAPLEQQETDVPLTERQEAVVPSPEVPEPDPDPIQQRGGASSAGVFIIKRYEPQPHVAERMWHPIPQSQPVSFYTRCASWKLNNEYYFLPYHSTDAMKQYLISQRLVQDVWQLKKCGNFLAGASVSLTCRMEIGPKPLCRDGLNRGYWELQFNGSIYAEGFEYENGRSGGLRFQKSNGGIYAGSMILTVLFSETLPDYPVLCEKYGDSNFLLWYSTRTPLEFLFFNIREGRTVRQRTTGFQIKNRPMQESVELPGSTLRGEELIEVWFRDQVSENVPARSYLTRVSLRHPRTISSQILKIILQYLRGYTTMTERFCAAVGYKEVGAEGKEFVIPQLPHISELKFFVEENLCGWFSNFNGQTMEGSSHFLFVLANYEVNTSWLKENVPGYSTAFCINLNDRIYHFYLMR